MRPMHKSGVIPDKTSKRAKRVHRWDREMDIPDDKGAARAERRCLEIEDSATMPEGDQL